MKQKNGQLLWRYPLFLLVFVVFTFVWSRNTTQVMRAPHSFGKTHFISGLSDYSFLTPSLPLQTKSQRQSTKCKVLFSPRQEVCDQLCYFIAQEQCKIYIDVYTLTDTKIAKALIAAHERGVLIEISTDRSSPLDRATKIGMLAKAGIPVFLYQPPLENNVQKGLMHNKFALFFCNHDQKEIVWHGSFNFSRSGYVYNCESVLILEDHELFLQFVSEHEHIKQKSIRYSPSA